ncbi:MAG TPA: hypothetical protein V6D17_10450 [Candidatus Obscuribacterales bacterium]
MPEKQTLYGLLPKMASAAVLLAIPITIPFASARDGLTENSWDFSSSSRVIAAPLIAQADKDSPTAPNMPSGDQGSGAIEGSKSSPSASSQAGETEINDRLERSTSREGVPPADAQAQRDAMFVQWLFTAVAVVLAAIALGIWLSLPPQKRKGAAGGKGSGTT